MHALLSRVPFALAGLSCFLLLLGAHVRQTDGPARHVMRLVLCRGVASTYSMCSAGVSVCSVSVARLPSTPDLH